MTTEKDKSSPPTVEDIFGGSPSGDVLGMAQSSQEADLLAKLEGLATQEMGAFPTVPGGYYHGVLPAPKTAANPAGTVYLDWEIALEDAPRAEHKVHWFTNILSKDGKFAGIDLGRAARNVLGKEAVDSFRGAARTYKEQVTQMVKALVGKRVKIEVMLEADPRNKADKRNRVVMIYHQDFTPEVSAGVARPAGRTPF